MVKNKRAKVTKTNANRKNVQKETQSKLEEPKPTPQPELSEEEQSENEQLDSSAEESDVSDAEQAALDSKLVEELESSSGEDSSEEEEEEEEEEDDDDDDDEPSQDPFSGGKNKVLLNAEKEEALKQRTDKIKHRRANEPAGTATKPGVIYLGRIPHGFYEDEMRGYFSQFGTVTRLRLSRNKKTGKSKHYAFIEFADAEVAEIVAETMNNYLMFGHLLKCYVVPPEKIHEKLFVGANRKFKVIPRHKIAREIHNRPRTAEEIKRNNERLLKKERLKRKRIKEAGIDYDFPGFAATAQKIKTSHVRS